MLDKSYIRELVQSGQVDIDWTEYIRDEKEIGVKLRVAVMLRNIASDAGTRFLYRDEDKVWSTYTFYSPRVHGPVRISKSFFKDYSVVQIADAAKILVPARHFNAPRSAVPGATDIYKVAMEMRESVDNAVRQKQSDAAREHKVAMAVASAARKRCLDELLKGQER